MAGDDFNINLNLDITAGAIKEGMHQARCIDAKIEPNKARDGNNLVFEFEILSPDEKGKRIKMWQSLKESVAWRYTKVLAAFGIGAAAGGNTNVSISRQTLVGKVVKLQISHSDYQGEKRAQVDNVLPDGDTATAGGVPTPPIPSAPIPTAPIPPRPTVPTPAPVPTPPAPPTPPQPAQVAPAPAPAPVTPPPAPPEAVEPTGEVETVEQPVVAVKEEEVPEEESDLPF